jgi:hypothetical protein
MKYLAYLSQIVNKVAIEFELWAVYEKSLFDAVFGLLIYQFLEDIVLRLLKKEE